jgi:excinuclease ABC subunit A
VEGIAAIDKVIEIDQSPIGRTPRSNPATYTGLFGPIRELFAGVPESRLRGYKPGRFSFNVKGGRCENCRGDGILKIEMQFLPDVYVPCEVCGGKRYNREALEIHYRGHSIADVLEMTVEEALEVFQPVPSVRMKLQTLVDVGLGYVRMGQPATTLSGGEAQRVKLATELSRRATGRTVYLLDEPTTGLHFADVEKLLQVLHRLVETGNTVIVIEHNLDVIKTADWIIDLGPEGGARGGEVVVAGTPEKVAATPDSATGEYLARVLRGEPLVPLTTISFAEAAGRGEPQRSGEPVGAGARA